MVANEFIGFFSSIVQSDHVSIEDFSDRINLMTVILFLIMCLIISAKQYVLNPISCYVPVSPSGENFNQYLADYCWVHGTIPLRRDESLPSSPEEWKVYDDTRRISYYQWVPFVLGLQCILFYLPHIVWEALCRVRAGGDLFELMKATATAATEERGARDKKVKRVAEFIEDMLDVQRDCHKDSARRRGARRMYKVSGLCIMSKRLGTCLVYSYILVKIFTIVISVVQLFLIQHFLGFQSSGSAGQKSMQLGQKMESSESSVLDFTGLSFGMKVAQSILSGRDWSDTLMFPRVAHCYVKDIRLPGVVNEYTAQCTLPLNMLNEKIYIFFWFWIVFLIIATSISLSLWLLRMIFATRRKDFIKRFLRIKQIKTYGKRVVERADLTEFIDDHLRYDGVFLLRMLALNAGDVITAEIVVELYLNYVKLYSNDLASVSTEDEKKPAPDEKVAKNRPPSFV